MIKRIFTGIIILLFCTTLTSCMSREFSVNSKLNDFGGVYSASLNDINFNLEISGNLSEKEAVISSDKSNKLLRWGISRRQQNQTPQADPGAPELLEKYNSKYLGDTTKKSIYLTFDEGYENGYTSKILDTLKNNNAKGVFFITGPYLNVEQELVRRMVEEGHYLGNHTIHHPSLPSLDDSKFEEELLGLDRAFHEKFEKNMVFLRPPKGEYSERTLQLSSKLGYCNLFWSFAYDDWYRDKTRGAEYAYNIVMRNLHNGAVLLLHAVSKDNAEALDMIIKGAIKEGYTIGDPADLLPK